jgi:apolipoprotein D and lipocalin family protein
VKGLCAFFALAIAALPATALATAPPAKPVDLSKYAGRWYEVAHSYTKREADCLRGIVDYQDQGGNISVTETCRTTSGGTKVYHPRVRILDPGTNAKLRLTFLLVVNKEFWVADHAPDYSWAILGSPGTSNFWIFARTPELPQPLTAEIVARAKQLGWGGSGPLVYDKP